MNLSSSSSSSDTNHPNTTTCNSSKKDLPSSQPVSHPKQDEGGGGQEEEGGKRDVPAWNDSSQAQHYSQHATRITRPYAEDLVVLLHSHIIKSKTILEIGCGPGTFGIAYMNQFPKGISGQRLICTDISPAMIEECQSIMTTKLGNNKGGGDDVNDNNIQEFATQIDYQVLDGSQLEGIVDGSIDLVISIFGIFLIPQQEETMASINRVLNPNGGIFATTTWTTVPTSTTTTMSTSNDLAMAGFGVGFHATIEDVVRQLHSNKKKNDQKTTDEQDKMTTTEPSSSSSSAPPPPQPVWKQWFDPEEIRQTKMKHFLNNDHNNNSNTIQIYRSLHSITWSSGNDLWELLYGNPMMGFQSVSIEEQQIIKQYLMDKVYHHDDDDDAAADDGCTTTTTTEQQQRQQDHPVMLWTASNLIVATKTN